MVGHGDREEFVSFDEALTAWRPIEQANLVHIRTVFRLLRERLGEPVRPYIGQQRNAVGVSFDSSTGVDFYVSPGLLAIAPGAVARLGGQEEVAAMHPGFVPGIGQRSGEARFELPSHRSAGPTASRSLS